MDCNCNTPMKNDTGCIDYGISVNSQFTIKGDKIYSLGRLYGKVEKLTSTINCGSIYFRRISENKYINGSLVILNVNDTGLMYKIITYLCKK